MSTPQSTPNRKALMPPPLPPTPLTPSNALVLRGPLGPLTPTTPSSQRSPKMHTALLQVKQESSLMRTPKPPIIPPTPSSLIRSPRSLTPSIRRRSSATPSRRRASTTTSSASFLAKLQQIRGNSSQGSVRNAAPGPAGGARHPRPLRNEDEDPEQRDFWSSGNIHGSSVNAVIEIDSDEEISPIPSPTPTANRNRETSRSPIKSLDSLTTHTEILDEHSTAPRGVRQESTFSLFSHDSRASPFVRDPTWDDSDLRYGRQYPRADGRTRENGNPSIDTSATFPSIPLSFARSIEKVATILKFLEGKHEEKKLEEAQSVDNMEKLDIICDVYFPSEFSAKYREFIYNIKAELETSNIAVNQEAISSIIRILKTSLVQSIRSFFNEYKETKIHKGTKEIRQNLWFNEFKSYLRISKSTSFSPEMDKMICENILLSLRSVLDEKKEMTKIINSLNDKFENINILQARRVLDAIIDLSAQVINIIWTK
ncbi:uncharacterized protein L201_006839 [Kwoniella dendrophila CBS 6074]|uniref:Uncharacterized protein n=1 Tax=Kwoniella dendrophila CBS 6074 TaxID=1295534 RepID=A0AAX4K517_9TREE